MLLLAAGFVLFMGLIRAVHAVDDYSLGRYGYAPFGLPNVLFMLIPHLLVILAVRDAAPRELAATLAAGGLLAMLLLIKSRSNGWIALFAASVQLVTAPVLVFAVLFRRLAGPAGGGPGPAGGG